MIKQYLDSYIQYAITRKVHALIDTYKEKTTNINVKNMEYPEIKFNLTGRCAGTAVVHRSCWSEKADYLRFNMYMARNNFATFLSQTVTHEVSHIIQYRIDSTSQPHGALWKQIMLEFGRKPERCHTFACEPSKRRMIG